MGRLWDRRDRDARTSTANRFMRKIVISGDHWLWQRSGWLFKLDGVPRTYTYVAWAIFYGPPCGVVRRICGVDLCCRPEHLRLIRRSGGFHWRWSWKKQIDHFWAHVNKSDGCWLWYGGVNGSNYGRYQIKGFRTRKGEAAHRIALRLSGTPVDKSAHVHHVCGVKLCCNPKHLAVLSPIEHGKLHGSERSNI